MLRILFVVLALVSCLSLAGREQEGKKTDAMLYRSFCAEVCKTESLFRQFRRQELMKSSLERYDKNTAMECLAYIETHCPAFTTLWDVFRENDRIGNPMTEQFPSAGAFSPSTLRLVKIAADLQAFFMPLENFKVVEIGGGYGGLCRLLTQVFNVNDYTIVDWPESLELARKYLEKYHITNVKFLTPDQIDQGLQADLVIGGDVFSFGRKELQERYIQKIAKYAPRGYLICHYKEREGMVTLKPKEISALLRSLHPGLHSLPENPKTSPCGWLHVWND